VVQYRDLDLADVLAFGARGNLQLRMLLEHLLGYVVVGHARQRMTLLLQGLLNRRGLVVVQDCDGRVNLLGIHLDSPGTRATLALHPLWDRHLGAQPGRLRAYRKGTDLVQDAFGDLLVPHIRVNA
jgi:hypothetical protein